MGDDELALLDRWCAGDGSAGNTLFGRHFATVYRFFEHTVDKDVDELVQETFLACLRDRDTVRRQRSFRTYLLATARHTLFAYFRASSAAIPSLPSSGRPRNFRDYLFATVRDKLFPYFRGRSRELARMQLRTLAESLSAGVEKQLERNEDQARLLHALRRLPLEQQILLKLYYWEGLDLDQLAEVLEIEPASTGHRLLLARQGLRKLLAEDSDPGDVSDDDLDAWAARELQPLARRPRPQDQGDRNGGNDMRIAPARSAREIRAVVETDWEDPGPILRVINSLARVAPATSRNIGLDDILRMSSTQSPHEALKIAEYLASERIGLLVARFELVGHDGRKPLPDSAVYAALRTGTLRDPQTGDDIDDWP
jgi:RNA polymerase sigma-70 factor (ECF subfamily)